jgi:hypothetical protein
MTKRALETSDESLYLKASECKQVIIDASKQFLKLYFDFTLSNFLSTKELMIWPIMVEENCKKPAELFFYQSRTKTNFRFNDTKDLIKYLYETRKDNKDFITSLAILYGRLISDHTWWFLDTTSSEPNPLDIYHGRGFAAIAAFWKELDLFFYLCDTKSFVLSTCYPANSPKSTLKLPCLKCGTYSGAYPITIPCCTFKPRKGVRYITEHFASLLEIRQDVEVNFNQKFPLLCQLFKKEEQCPDVLKRAAFIFLNILDDGVHHLFTFTYGDF